MRSMSDEKLSSQPPSFPMPRITNGTSSPIRAQEAAEALEQLLLGVARRGSKRPVREQGKRVERLGQLTVAFQLAPEHFDEIALPVSCAAWPWPRLSAGRLAAMRSVSRCFSSPSSGNAVRSSPGVR